MFHPGCPGFTRRDVLRLGAVGLSALMLPNVLRAERAGGAAPKAKHVIFIWQQGGPPHQDQIDEEPDKLRDRYGRTKLGQRLLLARRLIEAGVRFVTISEPVGWDTHADNFKRLRDNLPVVDQAVSALLDDLSERGLLDDTLVMMFGEFGRTPKINAQAGRDHWAQAMSIVLAGGGTPGGLVYGATDKQGAFVTEASHSPADFACTVYTLLGIDPHKQYQTPTGQAVPVVQGGKPIRAVL